MQWSFVKWVPYVNPSGWVKAMTLDMVSTLWAPAMPAYLDFLSFLATSHSLSGQQYTSPHEALKHKWNSASSLQIDLIPWKCQSVFGSPVWWRSFIFLVFLPIQQTLLITFYFLQRWYGLDQMESYHGYCSVIFSIEIHAKTSNIHGQNWSFISALLSGNQSQFNFETLFHNGN